MNQVKTDPADIKEQITYCVLNAISGETDPSDEKLREIISDVISDNPSYKMNLDQKREMAQMVFNSLRRLDVIEPLMEDPSVTEIMVNGPYKIFFERGGKLYIPIFLSAMRSRLRHASRAFSRTRTDLLMKLILLPT